jgi:ribosomal protein S24E
VSGLLRQLTAAYLTGNDKKYVVISNMLRQKYGDPSGNNKYKAYAGADFMSPSHRDYFCQRECPARNGCELKDREIGMSNEKTPAPAGVEGEAK